MANSDKNIVITPNIGSTSDDPKIVFSGADSSTSAQDISLKAYSLNNGTLSIEGSAGQLFSVTNSLSGTLFSVNDVSGMPSIEVLDDGTIKLAEYGGNIIFNESGADVDFRVEGDTNANLLFVDASTDRVGIGTSSPSTALDVSGTVTATSFSGDGSALTGVGADVFDDATHQLGGNLDLNSNDITGTGNININGFATTTILQNPTTYSGSLTIDTDRNAIVAGPFTVTGTLTIPSGSTLVVV